MQERELLGVEGTGGWAGARGCLGPSAHLCGGLWATNPCSDPSGVRQVAAPRLSLSPASVICVLLCCTASPTQPGKSWMTVTDNRPAHAFAKQTRMTWAFIK